MSPELPKTKMKIVPNSEYWHLCPDSELYMRQAIGENAVVILNGIPVKLVGKVTGLVLKDTPVENDIMKAGSWYSPRSKYVRDRVRRAYYEGKTELFLPRVKWVYMRRLRDILPNGTSPTLDFVQKNIDALSHTNSTRNRRDYYNFYHEDL